MDTLDSESDGTTVGRVLISTVSSELGIGEFETSLGIADGFCDGISEGKIVLSNGGSVGFILGNSVGISVAVFVTSNDGRIVS